MTSLFKTIFIYCFFFISLSSLIPAGAQDLSTSSTGYSLSGGVTGYLPRVTVVQPSISIESLSERIAQLKLKLAAQSRSSIVIFNANADLQSAVANLHSTVASLQSRLAAQTSSSELSIKGLASKMEAQSNSINGVSESLKSNVATLKFQLEEQSNSSSTDIAALKSDLKTVMQSPMMTMSTGKAEVDGPMPTNCSDVQKLGWTMNGFYTVKGRVNKVGTVYCDFTKSQGEIGFETVIGFNDVKTSTGVNFEVARNTSLTASKVIPWEIERLNIGGAMNLKTGVFTAPVNGRYQFSFNGRAASAGENYVTIRVNGRNGYSVGFAFQFVQSGNLPLMTTVNLKKDDTVDAFLNSGLLFDDYWNFTRFSGILLEEDLNL